MTAWGKFERSTGRLHRLEHHCADVAACFEVLVRDSVTRSRFETAAKVELCPTLEARLTVLAYLHDFGKLNAGFQLKVLKRGLPSSDSPPRAGHIVEALICCETQEQIKRELGLYQICDEWGSGVEGLLRAALSHHGRPAYREMQSGSGPPQLWSTHRGEYSYSPIETAVLLGTRCREWFPNAFVVDGRSLPSSVELAHIFAGIVALADQVGSNEEWFPYESDIDPGYIQRARQRADQAVRASGLQCFERTIHAANQVSFQSLFDHSTPRPLQVEIAKAPLNHNLLILESETGSGKTEAAVLRFAALWQAGLVDSLYFAVPTRSAAKQLHARINSALTRLLPNDRWQGTVLAIPGYMLVGEHSGQPIGNFQVHWEDEPDEESRLARWSAECARRFLTSTAAVGTVDQVLLAGLKVKWAHLRGASLSRSLLVIDEVHASDAYMTELLRAVLCGHLGLGGHALLMSATLGSSARVRLADTSPLVWIPDRLEAENVPYPAVTLAGGGESKTVPITESGRTKSVSLRVEPISGAVDRTGDLALSIARCGAKVLVIRNTVSLAQKTLSAIEAQDGGDLALQVAGLPTVHHSRFAAEDRGILDDAVEEALRKGRSPDSLVVVGTQTLEQSLDIDADYLITDICPVDVLLQRIGRLHRHQGVTRQPAFAEPQCVVLTPEEGLEAGLGGRLLKYGLGQSQDGTGGVYRDLLGVEATRRLIVEHPVWTIPAMNRLLVERATHPNALENLAQELGGRWQEQRMQNSGQTSAERRLAMLNALYRTEQFDHDFVFPDDNERGLRTRLGEDGPRITLAKKVLGPFRHPVQTFNLPLHIFGRGGGLPTREDINNSVAEPFQDGLLLRIGEHEFRYDRLGIARI